MTINSLDRPQRGRSVPAQTPPGSPPATWPRRLRVAGIVWLAMLGLDFLLNGALFARLYLQGGSFLLEPQEAFRRIPAGYLAFLILAVGVVELAYRVRISTLSTAVRVGLLAGAAFGGIWSLSLYSVATLSASTAISFGVIWLALVALAVVIAALGLNRSSLRGLLIRVAGFDAICAVTVIALQSLSVIPTVKP
jgi:hypothetical protein